MENIQTIVHTYHSFNGVFSLLDRIERDTKRVGITYKYDIYYIVELDQFKIVVVI